MFFNEVRPEPVVAGWHRRVRGEHNFTGYPVHRLVETQTLLLHAISNGFKDRESAVSLVEVKHARGNPHRLQSAKSSHAEQQLLANSNAGVSTVKTRGKLHVLRRIPLDV